MTDEEYQLRFNEQVFIDLEFKTKQNNQSTFIAHNDNASHKTYVKYWTYEDDGTKVTILYNGDTASSTYEYTIEGNTLTIKDSFGNDVKYVKQV